jgi:hypothetical protein
VDTNVLIRILLLLVPAGLFLYLDKNLLISTKIQTKFKINSFLGLYAFIVITLVLSTFVVGTVAMIVHISSAYTYAIQSMLIGAFLGLFSNIQKIIRGRR